jgi:hypothetical protein
MKQSPNPILRQGMNGRRKGKTYWIFALDCFLRAAVRPFSITDLDTLLRQAYEAARRTGIRTIRGTSDVEHLRRELVRFKREHGSDAELIRRLVNQHLSRPLTYDGGLQLLYWLLMS